MLPEKDIRARLKTAITRYKSEHPLDTAQDRNFITRIEALAEKCTIIGRFSLKEVDEAISPGITKPDSLKTQRSQFLTKFNKFCTDNNIDIRLWHDTKRTQPEHRQAEWQGQSSLGQASIDNEDMALNRTGNSIVKNRASPRPMHIFVSTAEEDSKLRNKLLSALRENLKRRDLEEGNDYTLWVYDDALNKPNAGSETMETQIINALEEAHLALPLLSPSFFDSKFIRYKEIPRFVLPAVPTAHESTHILTIPVLLYGIEDVKDTCGMLLSYYTAYQGKAYSQLNDEKEKEDFENLLADRIAAHFHETPPPESEQPPPPKIPSSARLRDPYVDIKGLVPGRARQDILDSTHRDRDSDSEGLGSEFAQKDDLRQSGSGSVEVQKALKDWLNSPARPFMALLGDYGMGKTTSCRLLSRNLRKNLRKKKADYKNIDIYYHFNLQDFTAGYVDEDGRSALHADALPLLRDIIAACLRTSGDSPEAAEVLLNEIMDNLEQKRLLVIFDGLDEALVHLNASAAEAFIQQLLRILPPNPQYDGKTSINNEVAEPAFLGKLLISCRTHFFPTLKAQAQILYRRNRSSIQPLDWASLLLLPFNEEQIREYFDRHFPERDPDEVIEILGDIHDLKGLASRPYLLDLIAAQIKKLEDDRQNGRLVNTARLYDNFVEDWLLRDEGKHQISPFHKPMIMEALAEALWENPDNAQSFENMALWFEDFVLSSRVLKNRYGDRASAETFLEDLRTATFIRRRDDDRFGFVHRSVHEYFMARRLLNALSKGDDGPWRLTSLSSETIDFVADLWQIRSEETRKALPHFEQWLGDFQQERSANLFKFYKAALERDIFLPHAKGINLGNLDISELSFKGTPGKVYDLSGLTLKGGRMSQGEFKHVDFSRSHFELTQVTGTIFNNCDFAGTTFHGVNLNGSTFRYCYTHRCEFHEAPREFARLIEKPDNPLPQISEKSNSMNLISQLGHSGEVLSAAFSPDGSLLATASIDGSAILWDSRSGQVAHWLKGYSGEVLSAAFSPDGSLLATASYDGSVILWNSLSGKIVHRLKGHLGWVQSAAFSPDGSLLATTSDGESAILWDSRSGQVVHRLKGHSDRVRSTAFSPDGSLLATASTDGSAILWDSRSGQVVHRLKGHSSLVRSAMFSPDGSLLATASADGSAILWDSRSGQVIHRFTGHSGGVESVAFSPDGSLLATASADKSALLWDSRSGQVVHRLKGHSSLVRSAMFSPDGSLLATASADGSAILWDSRSGQVVHRLKGHSGGVESVAFSPDGSLLATASADGSAILWDSRSGQVVHRLKGHLGGAQSAAFSPDGSLLATASYDKSAILWDSRSGQVVHRLKGHLGGVISATFSPDGRLLVTASFDGSAILWDSRSGQVVHRLKGHSKAVISAAFSPDGRLLSTASGDGSAILWDSRSGQVVHRLKGHSRAVISVAFSPDGSLLATASTDESAILWDSRSGQVVHRLKGHSKAVISAAFSPDGSLLATVSHDGSAILWDSRSGQVVHWLKGHSSLVESAAFSPDGSLLATASYDGSAILWDSRSGQDVHRLKGHSGWVQSAAFSPDGSLLSTTSTDGSAILWASRSGKVVHWLKGHSGRVYSAAFSPDGNLLATASADGSAILWDSRSGQALSVHYNLPEENTAVFDLQAKRFTFASEDAWKWFAWRIENEDGNSRIVPAEYFGSLVAHAP